MNFRQLELFIAIAETGSMSRGAEAIALAQSTVSQHVASLEEDVGLELFDRSARGVVLTSAGELFLTHARRVISERDSLKQSLAAYRGLEKACLTIGASNIPATYLVPPLLVLLQGKHPGISLHMVTGDTNDVLGQLERSEVELAVVGSRSDSKVVSFAPLMNDPLVLVVGAAHRWADRHNISGRELISEPMVVRERGSGSGLALDSALRRAGLDTAELQVAARLGSNEAVLQAVVNGFGCAFVSELSVGPLLKSHKLRKISVDGLNVKRKIWVAQMKSRSVSPAAKVFLDLLSEHYAE